MLYHLIHALALVLTGQVVSAGDKSRALSVAGWSFVLGIVLFSGSLYALALNGPSFLGPVTPVGGLCFIVGWLALAVASWYRVH